MTVSVYNSPHKNYRHFGTQPRVRLCLLLGNSEHLVLLILALITPWQNQKIATTAVLDTSVNANAIPAIKTTKKNTYFGPPGNACYDALLPGRHTKLQNKLLNAMRNPVKSQRPGLGEVSLHK